MSEYYLENDYETSTFIEQSFLIIFSRTASTVSSSINNLCKVASAEHQQAARESREEGPASLLSKKSPLNHQRLLPNLKTKFSKFIDSDLIMASIVGAASTNAAAFKKTVNVQDEPSLLILALFKAPPSLDFYNIVIGSTAYRLLHVQNPSEKDISVKIENVHTDKGLRIDCSSMYVTYHFLYKISHPRESSSLFFFPENNQFKLGKTFRSPPTILLYSRSLGHHHLNLSDRTCSFRMVMSNNLVIFLFMLLTHI